MNAFHKILFSLVILSLPARAGSPKIGCAAEVGQAADASHNWALVMLKLIDDAEPHDAYRIYWKAGNSASASPYTLLATLQPMVSPVSLTQLLDRAGQAGVDIAAFEQRLDGMLDGQGPDGSLAEKLSFFLQAQSESGVLEFQRDVLANSHPLMAAALGRAYFATVPANGASTFEVRAFDPANGQEGAVLGRPSVQAAPSWLPAPDCLAEKIEESAKGHLRVQLRWCYPLPLRHRFLHFGGTRVVRASVTEWQAAFGEDPPLAMNRVNLMQAVADGHAVAVNGLPLIPEERPADDTDPAYATPLFTDDNDRADESSLTSGIGFTAGDEYVYWVWEEDLFGRPGFPSPGARVMICDRLAPDPPTGLTASNQRVFQAGVGEDFLRIEWPVAPSAEVRRWYLYCSQEANGLLEEYPDDPENPIVAGHLVAVIDNDGSHATADGQHIRFDHTSTAAVPLPAPAVHVPLPAPGETVYYRLRAEDDTLCKDEHDRGNISGPSGPVPASRHDWVGSSPTGAWLEIPCCHLQAKYLSPQANSARPYTAVLRALRPGPGFQWVEFRDQDGLIGRYEFAPGENIIEVSYQPGIWDPRIYGARFGHLGGIVSDWKDASAPDSFPAGIHQFEPSWACEPIPPVPTTVDPPAPHDCPGYHLPLDPETGEPNKVCVRFPNLAGDLGSWIVYKQWGSNGKKTKLASGNIGPLAPPVLEVCDDQFPPHGGEICYYVQGFDASGNPGPMELAGCVKVAPIDGLPRPAISKTAPTNVSNPEASMEFHDIGWFCPQPAERFEVALSPAPAAAGTTFLAIAPSGQFREWGIIETPRTATGWGQTEVDFLSSYKLVHGVDYQCKVRAVSGHGEERDHGPWSEIKTLHWLNQPDQQAEVPWPMRDAPGITGAAHMEWDNPEGILRVEIGALPIDTPDTPLPADTMEPYLYHDLPLVAYLRDTTPGARSEILQVTHRIDTILTQPAGGGGGIVVIDQAVKTTPGDGGLGRLWLRIDQPVLAGHTYEVFLLLMNPDGETREVLRSNSVKIPLLVSILP